MNPFGDDPFESIVREFFGGRSQSKDEIIQGEEEERNIDFVETKEEVYLVFELPGYSEKDIQISIKGNDLFIKASRKPKETDDNYIAHKLSNGITFEKTLPRFVKTKDYSRTFKNGVLEIKFKKK